MYKNDKQKFRERINFSGDIKKVLNIICSDYHIGTYINHKIILIGYEDLNIELQTNQGKYLVKILSQKRNTRNRQRYNNIIKKILQFGRISYPDVYHADQEYLYELRIENVTLYLFVMEYINGQNLYELKEKLNTDELIFLTKQIAFIANIDLKPDFFYDDWAVINLQKEFRKNKKHLKKIDLELLSPIVNDFTKLELNTLPFTFSHGDLLDTNIMKDTLNNLWIIDFSVANYYPRINDLAVFMSGPAFNPHDPNKFLKNYNIILDEYQKSIKLEKRELNLLPLYIKAAHAMNILGALRDIVENGVTEESYFWLENSKSGLNHLSHIFPNK